MDREDKILIFCVIFAICVGSLLGFCLNNTKYSTITHAEIYSLQYGGNEIYGHFFLGSGCVNSYPVYFYYENTVDGGYTMKIINTGSSTIYMDENKTPYIETVSNYNWFLQIIKTEYKLHVPYGTVIEKYSVN